MSSSGAPVGAVVNLHREGKDAVPSLVSAWRAVEYARASGTEATLTLVLDDPDDTTADLADYWHRRYGCHLTFTEVRDLGLARNHASNHIDVEWLAFLDGDDLWGRDWLARAHAVATTTNATTVLHPALNIIFGDHHSLLHHIDSTDPAFRWSRFHLHNAWTALSFVSRELVIELPYPQNDLANGFGFEDWSWNMAVLDHGGQHRVVPDTCHFIRRLDGTSLLSRSQRALRTIYPSPSAPPERPPSPPMEVGKSAIDTGTHRIAPVAVSQSILNQVRLASTIEPRVEETLSADGLPTHLQQNFNDHTMDTQVALEELWALREPAASVAEICERATSLSALEPSDRTSVVAEFLRTERQHGRQIGESPIINEASARFSQLLSPRDRTDPDS